MRGPLLAAAAAWKAKVVLLSLALVCPRHSAAALYSTVCTVCTLLSGCTLLCPRLVCAVLSSHLVPLKMGQREMWLALMVWSLLNDEFVQEKQEEIAKCQYFCDTLYTSHYYPSSVWRVAGGSGPKSAAAADCCTRTLYFWLLLSSHIY